MKRFKAIVCPKCGFVQSTEAEGSIKCFGCGKSTVFSKLKVLQTFDTGQQSALFIQEYKKQKWETQKQNE
jgi:uncharacterized Zn finger protein (UPF0148 family)